MSADLAIAAAGSGDIEAVRALLREYFEASAKDPDFTSCLASQGAQAEIAGLPGEYAPPRGRLLLARVGNDIAGCVALRPSPKEEVAEAKRLFVRPRFRDAGVGRALVEALLQQAVDAGYRRIVLDTLPSMQAAQAVYRRLGFLVVAPSTSHPVAGAVCMELALPAR